MANLKYDYIIVGGGSAGCALANRLSTNPANRVLVLEAGRPDYIWDIFIHMPAGLTFPLGNKFYDWCYESEPEPHMNQRRIFHGRGKVLGGSSSINGMIYIRGNAMDYERWGKDPGMQNWDYAHNLPYFKRAETRLTGADEYHGVNGPLLLETGPCKNPLFGAFLKAVQEAGYPLTEDVNGYRQEGFGAFDRNIYRGRRLSAARAYLHPVKHRPNLTVICRAFTNRILFDGKKAVGVEYVKAKGPARKVYGGEVICCGGAINSPQLLQVSGVGNAVELERMGIQPVHDLPGVGENLQDHLEVYVQYALQAAGFRVSGDAVVQQAAGGVPVAFSAQRGGGYQPFRSRRVHSQQRRGGLPQPAVSLSARGRPLRRVFALRWPRLPGPCGPHVLRRPGFGED